MSTGPPSIIEGRDALQRGRQCYEQNRWGEAVTLLSQADRLSLLGPEDLERLAWAAGLAGRDQEMLAALERLHQLRLDAGDAPSAALAAFWVGFRLFALGEPGRASGWLARAQRSTEGVECVARGYLLLPVCFQHIQAGDWAAAEQAAERAAEVGRQYDDADLIAFAQNLQGRALIRSGRVASGLNLLDEVMVQVTTGEISPLMTGLVACSVIATCQRACVFDRAREWTSALDEWCQKQPDGVVFQGSCLVHRAEALQLSGAWGDAIEEARRASECLSAKTDPAAYADAFYQEAEISRLRGNHDEAEQAYRRASESGRDPQPGLALLRLAQRRDDAAAAAIRRAVNAASQPLERARLLPAVVEILLATGDREAARSASLELEAIARAFDTQILGAMAAHARGAVLLADGDAAAACALLRSAFGVWRGVGAPYIAARVRVLIGRACGSVGDADTAALEFAAAREVFERLEAAPDLDALCRLESPVAAEPAHPLTRRELEVLRWVARGVTNKQIAGELSLSEKTVDRHVSNIFTKLGVSSRAAATAHAYEHALL